MNYYSVKFNIIEDKEIINTETVGIKSAKYLQPSPLIPF